MSVSGHVERSEESSLFNKFLILHFVQDDRETGFATALETSARTANKKGRASKRDPAPELFREVRVSG